jgi:hypothetical protein
VVARLVNLPRIYDLSVTAGMALQGFGETLGLYDQFVHFDDLVHFTLPMLTAPRGLHRPGTPGRRTRPAR